MPRMALPHRAWNGPPPAVADARAAAPGGGTPSPPGQHGRAKVPMGPGPWSLAAAAVVLAASLIVTAVLEVQARDRTTLALDLTHWMTGALELDRAEDAALTTLRPVSATRLAQLDASFGRRSARALAALPASRRPQLAALAYTYRKAIRTVVADLAAGQVGWARQVDEGTEIAAFDAFAAQVRPLARVQVARASRDQRGADIASLVVLGLGGMVVSVLTVSGLRLRTRSAELAGERQALVRSEERLRALVHHGGDIVLVLDGPGQMLVWSSSSAVRLLGMEPEALVDRPLAPLLYPADADRLGRLFEGARDQPGLAGRVDLRLRHADGQWRDFETTVSNLLDRPEVGGWVLNARDVTDRRALELELRHAAYHDALTGLVNRTGFEQAVRSTLAGGSPAALILIELVAFKRVNDLYGNAAGDRLLATVANRLRTGAGEEGTVGRLGGDEFAVLLPDVVDGPAVEVLARRLVAAIGGRMATAGVATTVRARAGVALAGQGEDAEGLRRQADFALRTAGESKSSPVYRFTPETQGVLRRQLELEHDLAGALDREELVLHFQPIVHVPSGGVIGVEALLRWERPGHGLVPPAQFIPLAERTGLIMPIGRWVVQEACAQLARWKRHFPPAASWRMGVNLSASQLADPRLVDDVVAALKYWALPPDVLVLEITESMVAQDAEAAIELLSRLRKQGVGVSLDDFGTGYSSLSHLVRLPVDAIKIDRSFVVQLDSDPLAADVLGAVLRMASSLRMRPVVEGVETAGQVAHLRRMGCELVQGYYFARPMAAGDLEAYLAGGGGRLPAGS